MAKAIWETDILGSPLFIENHDGKVYKLFGTASELPDCNIIDITNIETKNNFVEVSVRKLKTFYLLDEDKKYSIETITLDKTENGFRISGGSFFDDFNENTIYYTLSDAEYNQIVETGDTDTIIYAILALVSLGGIAVVVVMRKRMCMLSD